MLIQVFTGAFGAQFLEFTFGPGAAEPRAVGGGFPVPTASSQRAS